MTDVVHLQQDAINDMKQSHLEIKNDLKSICEEMKKGKESLANVNDVVNALQRQDDLDVSNVQDKPN